MKIYKVSMVGDFGDAPKRTIWTSRKTDLPSIKRRLKEECFNAETASEPFIEEVDIKTTKKDLLEFLNLHATT